MGKISTGFSMSLDGFVAGPNDDITQVFKWMYSGDKDVTLSKGDSDLELKVSEESSEIFERATTTIGALIAGRHLFDITNGWGGRHPIGCPVVVVTHNVPKDWVDKPGEVPFTFVTDGLESAIAKARAIAGDKDIAIASTTLVQQALKANLLDEIHIDLTPFLLYSGVRLFDNLGGLEPTELEITKVNPAPGVTHITYRVIK
jgi:dihydrofolate reductase